MKTSKLRDVNIPIQYGEKFYNVKATYMEIYSLHGALYNLQRRGIFVRDDESFFKSLDKVKNFITSA